MKKILVIQTAFIGDVILATCVLEKLHRFFPDAHLHMLVRKGNESLFHQHPYLKRVWVWNKKEKKQAHLRQLIREIRAEHFDHVINLHRFSSSGLITMMSGAKEKAGFLKNPFAFSFDVRKKHVITKQQGAAYMHETERCLSLVEHLTDNSYQRPALYPTAHDEAVAASWAEGDFITVSPASVWFTKQTPMNVWKEWIRACPLPVVLLGGPGDKAMCEALAEGSSRVRIAAGELTLLQSAALMKRARMNYTNDSAPMHLCSAVNAPVTAVYCSTIPEFGFGPLSQASYVVQSRESLSCKPCGLHGHKACPKKHFRCGNISTSDLLSTLNSTTV